MGKKNRKILPVSSDNLTAMKYQFEFARRNKDYEKDYNILKEKYKERGKEKYKGWKKWKSKRWNKKIYRIREARSADIKAFERKWKIIPGNPRFTFEQLIARHKKKRMLSEIKKSFDDVSVNYCIMHLLNLEQPIFLLGIRKIPIPLPLSSYRPLVPRMDKVYRFNTVNVLINLNLPKEVILEKLSFILGSHCKQANKNRFHYNKYDTWLKVYDMATKKGMSLSQIAKIVYKDDAGGLYYANKKTRRDYERCKKMIEGGYRLIR